jgi:anthranilate phosphoribosyltransferase
MMTGQAQPSHISAFLTALKAKGETADDISALVDVMLKHAVPASVSGVTVDTCGTGGDGSHTVNISTMAAIVVAAAGSANVVKHGNRAASSKCGSADVLEHLGVRLDLPATTVSEVAEKCGITFFFAQAFHPALRHVGPIRRELGIPTVFNILGPLANPARPKAQVVGVANAAMGRTMAQVLLDRGTKALVVRGNEGLDELSIHGQSTIWSALGDEVVELTFDPLSLGITTKDADALRGGDAEFNARIVRDLFTREKSYPAIKDAVCLNAAAALTTVDAVSAPIEDLQSSLASNFELAKHLLDMGGAEEVLDRWISTTQSYTQV